MSNPWDPEFVVDVALAAQLIDASLPPLQGLMPVPFAEGWDNTAFRVGEWVVRFPRREVAIPLLEAEARVLPWLAPQLPAPIPSPVLLAPASDAFPAPFAAYPFMKGDTACAVEIPPLAWAPLARDVGAFLGALHRVDVDSARAQGAPSDTIDRLNTTRRLKGLLGLVGELEQGPAGALASLARGAFLRSMDDAPPSPDPKAGAVLCHGDLYGRHLLIGEGHSFAGVIDWGDVHIGHPGTDLFVLYAFFPPEVRGEFLAAYGPASEDQLKLALPRAFNSLFHVLAYGIDKGDLGMLRLGWRGLSWLTNGQEDKVGFESLRAKLGM